MGPIRRVGLIGLGNMGAPMAARLIDAGYELTGYDVAEPARAAFARRGGAVADDFADVARDVDALVLMLPSSRVVEDVLADRSLRAALPAGATVLDMGSSEPLATRALSRTLAESGVVLVDAPVSGGVRGATRGTLTIMVGGDEADVARVRPMLENLGRVVLAGPVGSGHAIKALNNLLSATHLWVTSEAMVAGRRFGLDPEVMLDVFNGSSGRSGSTQSKWPDFILPGTYDSGFGLRLMLKDMNIATGLASALEAPSLLGAQAAEHWAAAADDLPADADHTEVARWLADRAAGEPRSHDPRGEA